MYVCVKVQEECKTLYTIAVLTVDAKVAKVVRQLLHGHLPRLPWLKCSSEVLVYTNAIEIAGEGGCHSQLASSLTTFQYLRCRPERITKLNDACIRLVKVTVWPCGC